MSAWQPIETAPRDMTRVLVAVEESALGRVFIAGWYPDPEMPDDGAWYENWGEGFPVDVDVTHWMPLPEPPAAKGQT